MQASIFSSISEWRNKQLSRSNNTPLIFAQRGSTCCLRDKVHLLLKKTFDVDGYMIMFEIHQGKLVDFVLLQQMPMAHSCVKRV